MRQGMVEDVDGHAQGLFSFFGRVHVDLGVLEAVADVRLISIKDCEASFQE